MNKYCLILYIFLLFIVLKYDTYTTVLLFILIIGPFKCSTKEYFYDNDNTQSTTTSTTLSTTQSNIMSSTNKLEEEKSINNVVKNNLLGVDDRFKMDDIKKDEIIRQIKAQINFDPYKTNLSKDVIYEIYNKYFDNDIFVKLNAIDDDSKAYIASGNFNYVPKQDKVDYDLTTYNNLLKNTSFGVNSQLDTGKGLN
jgi:hypothetical protein